MLRNCPHTNHPFNDKYGGVSLSLDEGYLNGILNFGGNGCWKTQKYLS